MSNPPYEYKQEVIASLRDDYNILVETGTYNGDMVRAQLDNFDQIYSIELGDKLFLKAIEMFQEEPHVTILHGNSPSVLEWLVPTLSCPVLFWLDAHWSGGNTALGDKPCPLLEELDVILESPFRHGILIDDARCFGTLQNFPKLDEIRDKIGDFEVKNDIIWKI